MKHICLVLPLVLCLSLAACGPSELLPAASGSGSVPGSSVESSSSDASLPEPDASEPGAGEPASSEPDAAAEHPPLTSEEKDHAQDAALDYYLGTVFEVHSLTETDVRAGEITFLVRCSKGGQPVDPDRTISLERRDGTWTVVSEGY